MPKPATIALNASMLHELRMVFQHGFKLFKRVKTPAQVAAAKPVLLCVGCLRSNRLVPNEAITVSRGNAVCITHI